MSTENNKKRSNISGIETFLHLMESGFEAHKSGRIVSFGSGRLSNFVPDNTVTVTVEEIRNLPDSDNENEG